MGRLARLLKSIIAFFALFFMSYLLSVVVVIGLTYYLFKDANPRLEIVLLVYGVLIPAAAITGAIIGMRFLKKRSNIKTIAKE